MAWIDLNASGQYASITAGNNKLEEGEPFGVAPTVTFLKSVVVDPAWKLNSPTKGAFVTGDIMSWKASLSNQSGKVSETAGVKNVTFTIRNTSNEIQKFNPSVVDEKGNAYKELTVTYGGDTQTQTFTNGRELVLEPGTTVTLHGIATDYNKATVGAGYTPAVDEYSKTNDAVLNIEARQNGKLAVSSSVTTVRKLVTQNPRNNNNTYANAEKEAEFLIATDVTGKAVVTGEVIGFEVIDSKFGPNANFGRVVIKERVTGQIKYYYYNQDTSFSSSLDGGSFTGHDNVLTGNAATAFENLVSLGDEVQVNNKLGTTNPAGTDVRLFNKDNSKLDDQAKGNGVNVAQFAITDARTVATGVAGTVNQVEVTFNKEVTTTELNSLLRVVNAGTESLEGIRLDDKYSLKNPTVKTAYVNGVTVVTFDIVNPEAFNTAKFGGSTLTVTNTEAAKLDSAVALSYVVKDGVAPVIVGIPATSDKDDANGLDTIKFVFSEAIDLATVDAADFRFAVTGLKDPGYVSGKESSKAWDNKTNTLTIEFDNTTPNATATTLTYEYAGSNSTTGNKALADIAGNLLKSVSPTPVLVVDEEAKATAALTKAITDAKAITKGDYTDASWTAFQTALTEAEAVSATATAAVKNAATKKLTDAQAALEEKTTVSKTVKELNATVIQSAPGVFAVKIPLADAQTVGAVEGSTLTVKVTGKADITFKYNATAKVFVNANIQGYTQAEVEAGTVSVK